MTTGNPLLNPSTLPNFAPAFDQVRNEHYLPAIEQAIVEARRNIDAIKQNKAPPDFENTIVALENASETLSAVASVFYNMLSAIGGDALHALAGQIGPLNANFSSDVALDADLFKKIREVHDTIDKSALRSEQAMLLDETYKGFVRGGALLDERSKQRLREIDEQLSVLGPAYMQNVSKSAQGFRMVIDDPNDLAGLPQSAIDSAAFAANEKGHPGQWLFTLDMPSYGPFVQYAGNRILREKIWRAFSSRAWQDEFDNSENALSIARLRDERAKILGYKNHADFVLAERMAASQSNVEAFLNRLKNAYRPAALLDLERLRDFAKDRDGMTDLKPWDVAYYSEKLKESLYRFTSEDLRPYFPLDHVLEGCFAHFSRLFGLRFEQSDAYPVWHEDVKTYDVRDERDNRFIGTFYADFHPRTGKKDGAWMTNFRAQGLFHGRVERPVVAIVCNFTKPTPEKPSLLTHDEVTTLFHEMGHAIHSLVSNVTYQSLSGVNVLWDFVELPSQLQENWCYEKETLDLFAKHYETGENIPNDLIQKLIDAKNFMNGWMGLRQVGLGLLDMAWHSGGAAMDATDVAAFEDKTLEGILLFPRLAGPSSTSFSHIFSGGYSAGYYSYKWAEVLEADTFELFLERGLYDAQTAQAYRTLLSKGGSEHPRVLYHNFRGRDPDADALLRREGLLKKA